MIPTLFRRHTDGTVTDVYEDACIWVRDGEAARVQVHCLGQPVDVLDEVNFGTEPDALNSYCAIYTLFKADNAIGSIVFTHLDGRQAQITRQDFGL